MSQQMKKMREEFEAWCIQNDFMCDFRVYGEEVLDSELSKHLYGEYVDREVDIAWFSWRGSRAALCVELPENCKGSALTVDEFHRQLGKAGVSCK